MKALIVGQHFRPPSRRLFEVLPSGFPLLLEPEPENPYDAQAVKVLLRPEFLRQALRPEVLAALELDLPGFGYSFLEFEGSPPFHLGYLARAGNKDLAKLTYLELWPASQILERLEGGASPEGTIQWGPNGESLFLLPSSSFSEEDEG